MKVKVPPSVRSSLRILRPSSFLDPERRKEVRLQKLEGSHTSPGGQNAREKVIVATAICKLRARLSDHREAHCIGGPIRLAPHRRESLLAANRIAIKPGGHG